MFFNAEQVEPDQQSISVGPFSKLCLQINFQ